MEGCSALLEGSERLLIALVALNERVLRGEEHAALGAGLRGNDAEDDEELEDLAERADGKDDVGSIEGNCHGKDLLKSESEDLKIIGNENSGMDESQRGGWRGRRQRRVGNDAPSWRSLDLH